VVNDTSEQLASINDTTDKYFAGVNYTVDKFVGGVNSLSPVALTSLINIHSQLSRRIFEKSQ
jgi:hypothetical protein